MVKMAHQLGPGTNLFTAVLSILLANAASFDWLTEVPTAHACLHGEATFPWRYNESVYLVPMVQWRFERTGDTVIAHHLTPKDEVVTHFDTYTRRARIMEDANAGMSLKNVTDDDSGRYKVELSGVLNGVGLTELHVHTNDDLTATLRIDGTVVEDGHIAEKYRNEMIELTISTSQRIPALINIDLQGAPGQEITFCDKRPSCTRQFNLTNEISDPVRVHFIVNYGFCDIEHYTIHIEPLLPTTVPGYDVVTPISEAQESSGIGTSVAIVVLILLLLLFIIGIFISCVCLRRKKIQNADLPDLGEKYIGLTFGCCPIQKDVCVDTDETKFKLVSRYHQDQLRRIENISNEPPVIISEIPDERRFIIGVPRKDYCFTKTQPHIQSAQDELYNLMGLLETRQTIAARDLLSGPGREFLDQTEREHKVLCSAESYMETPVRPAEVFESGRDPSQIQFGSMVLEVVNGDVTKQHVDAVIAVLDTKREPHALVSKIILDEAGDDVKRQCQEYDRGSNKWKVMMVDGGDLSSTHLILVNFAEAGSDASWDRVLKLALQCAKTNGLKSVALPAFGAGPKDKSYSKVIANSMYKALMEFSSDPGSMKWVRVVVKDCPDVHNIFAITVADQKAHGRALNNMRLNVEQGDITKTSSDVVVNGTNPDFGEQGAVTKAIKKEGKRGVVEGWKTWKEKNGKLRTVALTDKGDLPNCKGIINLNTVDEQRDWPTRIYDVLVLAEKHMFSSVAFPAFGTGKLAPIAPVKIAPWMYKGIRRFADEYLNSSVTEVKIIGYDDKARKDFSDTIHRTHLEMPYLKAPTHDVSAPMLPPVERARVTIHTLPPHSSSTDDVIRHIKGFPGPADVTNHVPAAVGDTRDPDEGPSNHGGDTRVAEMDGVKPRQHHEVNELPREDDPLLGVPMWSYDLGTDGFQPFSLDVIERLEAAYIRGDRELTWTEQGAGSVTVSFTEPMTRKDRGGTVAVRREMVSKC